MTVREQRRYGLPVVMSTTGRCGLGVDQSRRTQGIVFPGGRGFVRTERHEVVMKPASPYPCFSGIRKQLASQ